VLFFRVGGAGEAVAGAVDQGGGLAPEKVQFLRFSGRLGGQGQFLTKYGVDQRALADVRPTNKGKLSGYI